MSLPKSYAINFASFIQEQTTDFTGREWVFAAVDRWMADPGLGRVFLLMDGPGSGKTAVAARLAQMSLEQATQDALTHLGKGSESFIVLSIPREERGAV